MKEYTITIRFYEELNDFLPVDKRKVPFKVSWKGKRSIKDLIESLGVPHTEIDLILVNGESVGFEYIVQNGDMISVYPVFERFDIHSVTKVREHVLRTPMFVCDVHLRKLTKYLRLLGFDVLYNESWDDKDLAQIAAAEKRILLTRDRQLLKRRIVERGLIVRNTDPKKQIIEILDRLDLWSFVKPFSRCMMCNGLVVELPKESNEFLLEKQKIPSGVLIWCTSYYKCLGCGKIYWEGSHYEKLKAKVNDLLTHYKRCNTDSQ